ncbi:MAG TPA: hypothetical protein GX733_08130, partial [Tissierellia bacterium]|nr:hypothetical protein [Tissierellia bacterium]
MNKSTGSLTLRDYFNIASTQFASILGPGVASGATVLAIFASRGWHASWLTFFGVGLSFVGYYFAMEYARLHQLRNYADVYKGLYGKLYRVATPFMDFAVAYAVFVGMAIVTAQFGSLMMEWGIPFFVGVAILWGFSLLGAIFGTDLFRKIQGVLSLILLTLTLVINVACIINGINIFKEIMSTRWMPEGGTFANAVYWAFQYGFVQIQMVTVLIPNLDIVRKKSDIKKALGVGYLMNMTLVGLQSIALLAFMPAV